MHRTDSDRPWGDGTDNGLSQNNQDFLSNNAKEKCV